MKVFLLGLVSIVKIVLFLNIIFCTVSNQGLYIPLVPILLAAMLVLSWIMVLSFLYCFCKNYDHKEWKILAKVIIMSLLETFFLGICLDIFLHEHIVNGMILFWILSFVLTLYWCRPTYPRLEEKEST